MQSHFQSCIGFHICTGSSESSSPGAQGEGGLEIARAAPAGEGGLAAVSEWGGSGFSGEGAELRWRGERALHSSRPLEEAAVAELQVALALRGCAKCEGKLDTPIQIHTTQNTSNKQKYTFTKIL